ncbi:MAG: hypothetical protein DCC68_05365 [Planctomycetota bacterium]|nr:MAG: hypothetical protein DCC68_05365 [Planctomycetota bacterium]
MAAGTRRTHRNPSPDDGSGQETALRRSTPSPAGPRRRPLRGNRPREPDATGFRRPSLAGEKPPSAHGRGTCPRSRGKRRPSRVDCGDALHADTECRSGRQPKSRPGFTRVAALATRSTRR